MNCRKLVNFGLQEVKLTYVSAIVIPKYHYMFLLHCNMKPLHLFYILMKESEEFTMLLGRSCIFFDL